MSFAAYQKVPAPTRGAIARLCQTYAQAGWKAYLVGGSVRDLLLDKVPQDFDLATDAPLEATRQLFAKCLETGPEHGTLTVRVEKQQFEVTRFRKDVATDGRHAVVAFSSHLQEDLARRDLTINALAYDPLQDQLLDPLGGLADFEQKIIRFVGQAQQRVQEDHLRALRYLRMIARLQPLGFCYVPTELEEVHQVFAHQVLSLERIYEELEKMGQQARRGIDFLVSELSRLRPLARFFAEPAEEAALYRPLLESQSLLPLAMWALAGHKPKELQTKFRLSRKLGKQAGLLLAFQGRDLSSSLAVKELLYQGQDFAPLSWPPLVLTHLGQEIGPLVQGIMAHQEPYLLSHLAVNGHNLMAWGVKGKDLSRCLHSILHQVWENPTLNQPAIIQNWLNSGSWSEPGQNQTS